MGRIIVAIIAVLAIAGGAWWYFSSRGSVAGDHLTVYYAKLVGQGALGTWTVSTRGSQPGESAEEHLHNTALYAAVQAVAGPPSDVSAIRFPTGTHVLNVNVTGGVATVDLSKDVGASAGIFSENGEFEGLVYTLTGITSVNAVQILIEGRKVETLPGGHLELDTPLRRSDW